MLLPGQALHPPLEKSWLYNLLASRRNRYSLQICKKERRGGKKNGSKDKEKEERGKATLLIHDYIPIP